jgi:hypothetical protein
MKELTALFVPVMWSGLTMFLFTAHHIVSGSILFEHIWKRAYQESRTAHLMIACMLKNKNTLERYLYRMFFYAILMDILTPVCRAIACFEERGIVSDMMRGNRVVSI